MLRFSLSGLVLLMGAGTQDGSQIAGLVRKLDSDDWVEQAQAAKELAKIGRPSLDALAGVMRTESESGRYWASIVSQAIMRNSGPSTGAAPASPETAAPSEPNPRGFAPTQNDLGSLVFICNNPSHGGYEVVFSRCGTCSKMKKFAYDYGADCYRCSVCKKAYTKSELKCDKCGQSPAPRMGIRMKSH